MLVTLEIVLTTLIIATQGYFFWITFQKIEVLRSVFPDISDHRITRVSIYKRDLETTSPQQILANLAKYQIASGSIIADTGEVVSLGLIISQNTNPINSAIHLSINTYLLRNSGAAPDFNLIRDIAERNSDALEEEIGNTVSVPLYLGMLGTLLGIIFGLFNISNLSFTGTGTASNVMLDLAIPALLGGVKIAMIASFTGLLLTVIHSGFLFKRAKAEYVRKKHDFFTFIQVELLPILNQNLNATLHSLQVNLLTFNKDFGHNIHRLDGLMNKNYDALLAQEHVLDILSKMDITEFATANVQTLAQLQTAIKSFGDFNQYVSGINVATQKTEHVIVRINELLGRTEAVESVTRKVMSVFDMNHELMQFLKSHFSALDNSKKMIGESVVGVNEQLTGALDDLKRFTAEKIASIQRLEIEHVDLMSKTYAEQRKTGEDPEQMLRILRQLADNGNTGVAQMAGLNSTLLEVRDAISNLDEHMIAQAKAPSITEVVKSWFKKENGQ